MFQTSGLHRGLVLGLKFDFQVSWQRFCRAVSAVSPWPWRGWNMPCAPLTQFIFRGATAPSQVTKGCRAHTKSQNHQSWERPLILSPAINPAPQYSPPSCVPKCHSQTSFEHFQGCWFQPLGQPVPVPDSPFSEEIFLIFPSGAIWGHFFSSCPLFPGKKT